MVDLIDLMHRNGVYFILWLQRVMADQGERMVSITRLGDPEFLIAFIFPLISAINSNLFIRVVLTTALVDMLNNILKWFLHGERPYWWVHECKNNSDLLSLKQFPLTCETGPGSPSGHAMLTAAVWYIILWFYVNGVAKYSKRRTILVTCIWTLYFTMFTMVSVSRLFIAAHFPHQVIAGGISGLAVGWFFTRIPALDFRFINYMQILGGMALFAAFAYSCLLLFGVDPNWSIEFAKKWCINPSWVHLSTTPLSSMFRDSGAIVGLALARYLEQDIVGSVLLHRDGREIVTALISFVAVQICAWLPVGTHELWIYYTCIFLKYTLISFVAIFVVPEIVKISMNLKEFPITTESKIKEIIDLTKRKRKYTAGF